MPSIRHTSARRPGGTLRRPPDGDHLLDSDDPFLDAARESILAVGLRRTTLTDVARRAGVSRMTIYRRWPDMGALLADLLVREWTLVTDRAFAATGSRAGDTGLGRLSRGVVRAVAGLRGNDLFARILDVDPELLLPYLLERRGRNQDRVLGLVETAIAEGQRDGSVRSGRPATLARALLLALHGFVLSADTMADPRGPSVRTLDRELALLVERYLAP